MGSMLPYIAAPWILWAIESINRPFQFVDSCGVRCSSPRWVDSPAGMAPVFQWPWNGTLNLDLIHRHVSTPIMSLVYTIIRYIQPYSTIILCIYIYTYYYIYPPTPAFAKAGAAPGTTGGVDPVFLEPLQKPPQGHSNGSRAPHGRSNGFFYRRSRLPFDRPQTLQTFELLQKFAQLRREKVPQ